MLEVGDKANFAKISTLCFLSQIMLLEKKSAPFVLPKSMTPKHFQEICSCAGLRLFASIISLRINHYVRSAHQGP